MRSILFFSVLLLSLPLTTIAEEFKFDDKVSCRDFAVIFGSDKVTTAQKDALFELVKNKQVTWTGEVVDVQKDIFGAYQVLLKCSPDSFVSDVAIYPKSDKGILDMERGKKITAVGTLVSWGNLLPHVVKEAEISIPTKPAGKKKAK